MTIFDIQLRLCPTCGQRTAAKLCPDDNTITVQLRKFTPGSDVKPGDLIGERYAIERRLGEGGYSSVFAAQHVVTGQAVAIKVLKATFPGPDEQSIQRFYREARVTAALSHPNTIRVFDVGQTSGGAFWLAMELLVGPSLEDRMQERWKEHKVLTQEETINFGVSVLRALHEAHGRKLVHRDLKPANVVLANVAGEQIVKVLDFGIAQTSGSTLTTTGMALGTPAYMSPEQCQGLDLDGRSDLYSLGIMMYRAVTGDVPFADLNPVKLMQAHLSRPLPDVRKAALTPLTQPFIDVLNKSLAKDLPRRYQSAQEMREALEASGAELSRTDLDMKAFRLDDRPPAPRTSVPRPPSQRPPSSAGLASGTLNGLGVARPSQPDLRPQSAATVPPASRQPHSKSRSTGSLPMAGRPVAPSSLESGGMEPEPVAVLDGATTQHAAVLPDAAPGDIPQLLRGNFKQTQPMGSGTAVRAALPQPGGTLPKDGSKS